METLWSSLHSNKLELEQRNETIRNDFNCALFSKFADGKVYSGGNIAGLDIDHDYVDVFVENVSTDDELATLQTMKDLICSNNSFCGVSLSLGSSAHIECAHVKTEVKCYLRLRNKMSVSRNRLIKYYLSLDSKLSKFMLLLKFWADCYDFIDPKAFSDSAIYLMAIFYLQQDPYKLPPVKDLQENVDSEDTASWNSSYAEILDFSSPALENATVLELFVGFLRFYSNFDYVTYVISPYFGSPLEKVRFVKPYVVPQCFTQFSTQSKDLNATSSICVQDFFEHCVNLTSSVTLDCVGRFTNLSRSCLQVAESEEDFLLYKFLVNAQPDIFEYPSFVIEKTNDCDEQEWIQEIKTLSLKILSDILNYKLSTISAFGAEKTSFGCVGQHDVWKNRVKAMKTLSAQTTLRGIDKEVAVTTQVIIDFPEKIAWNVFLDLTFLKNPSRVKVVFLRKAGCCNVYHVCHFLYTRLVKFLDGGRAGECLDIVEAASSKYICVVFTLSDLSLQRRVEEMKRNVEANGARFVCSWPSRLS